MRNFRKIFKVVFAVAFVMILVQWGLYVYLGYSVLSDPEGAGEVVGKFMDGVNK